MRAKHARLVEGVEPLREVAGVGELAGQLREPGGQGKRVVGVARGGQRLEAVAAAAAVAEEERGD